MLSAGAFSDKEVVDATKNVVCVYVDCEWGHKHVDLLMKYQVQSFPTVVYADSDGEEVGRMKSFDPEVLASEFATHARDHAKKLR